MAERERSGASGTAVPLPVYYMKMVMPQVDARLGKMKEGQIVAMPEDQAQRFLTSGAAEQVSEGEYNEQLDRRDQRQSARQEAFRAINDGHAMWDVSTYRDVLTAPEKGLRMAYDRGIPLINVHMLRDEEGDPLPPDADIEDILDARDNLHADLVSPLDAHDRSSVMGGGSPYVSNTGPRQEGPLPLNPTARAMAQRLNDNEVYSATPVARQGLDQEQRSPVSGRAAQSMRRARTLEDPQAGPTGQHLTPPPVAPSPMPAPAPPPPSQAREAGSVSDKAGDEGRAAGATKPAKPASGEQIGN